MQEENAVLESVRANEQTEIRLSACGRVVLLAIKGIP